VQDQAPGRAPDAPGHAQVQGDDEFIKRRAETERFVEGDFDTYASQIRKPHV